MRTLRHLVLSGFYGLLIPTGAFALSGVSRYCLVKNWIPAAIGWLVFPSVMLVEAPAVTLGRTLGLPIDTGVTAFFWYELSWIGYLWIVLYWIIAGVIAGSVSEGSW